MKSYQSTRPNPLSQFRNEHFLSIDTLAEICGVTRQIIQGVETGVFNSIPPSVIAGLVDEYDIKPKAFQHSYSLWVREQLTAINVNAITQVTKTPTEHIVHLPEAITTFRHWRKALCESNGYSNTYSGLSKLIKVQPVLIRKYECGTYKSFPGPLADRLRFWGFPENYLSEVAGLPIGKEIH